MVCPLCKNSETTHFKLNAPNCLMWFCERCDFVFKDERHVLGAKEEKDRYLLHKNGDQGHKKFLSQAVELIMLHCEGAQLGLDWGSGPLPVLQDILADEGLKIDIYDPYFAAKTELKDNYDFIVSTEVVEHMKSPEKEFNQWRNLLKPGGHVILMSDFWPSWRKENLTEFFQTWYYRKDPTHISFFSDETFEKSPCFEFWQVIEKAPRSLVLKRK